MSWPVGKLEQLLKIQELQQEFNKIVSGRKTVIIHSYAVPNRAEWELAYQQQLEAELPIPVGTKLCWYDMRNGRIRTFTTAGDQNGGASSSGTIYPYSHRQNSSYFRFLGNLDIAGYLRGPEDNHPSLHFGFNLKKVLRAHLLCLDLYLRINVVNSSSVYLYFSMGDLVTQVDLSGVLYRSLFGYQGGLGALTTAATAANVSNQNSLRSLDFTGSGYPSNSTYRQTPIVMEMKIFNPFSAKNSDSRTDGFAQTSLLTKIAAPQQDFVGVAGDFDYVQDLGLNIRTINFDQYYRIFQTTNSLGGDDALAREARAYAYGYFDQTIETLEEYE